MRFVRGLDLKSGSLWTLACLHYCGPQYHDGAKFDELPLLLQGGRKNDMSLLVLLAHLRQSRCIASRITANHQAVFTDQPGDPHVVTLISCAKFMDVCENRAWHPVRLKETPQVSHAYFRECRVKDEPHAACLTFVIYAQATLISATSTLYASAAAANDPSAW